MMTAEQLKSSILQLALHGKLVEQRSEEGTGEDLYIQIQKEKAKLIMEGKVKKGKPIPEISDEEIPFEIPNSWKWVRVVDVVYLVSGKQYCEKNKGVPYLKVADMNLSENLEEITTSTRFTDSDNEGIIPPYSIIFPKRGGAIATNKKRAVLKQPVFIDSNTMGMVVICWQMFDYLKQWFDTIDLGKLQSGTSVPQINNIDLYPLLVPLPPLGEQKRIVAKIEELMPFVEQYAAASTKLDTLNASFHDMMKKSILQEAVQGKLTDQNVDDLSAVDFLKEVKRQKVQLIKSGKFKKAKPQEPLNKDDLPFDIPENWVWCQVGDLFSNASGLSYKKGMLSEKSSQMVRILRGGNIGVQTYSFKEDDQFIKRDYVEDALYLKKGYMITPAVTSLSHIGKIGLIERDYDDVVAGGFVLMLMPYFDCMVVSKYLLYYFDTEEHRDACRAITHKSGQAFYNLSREKLMNLPIPLPPLEEMKRIVAMIEELMSGIKELAELNKNKE